MLVSYGYRLYSVTVRFNDNKVTVGESHPGLTWHSWYNLFLSFEFVFRYFQCYCWPWLGFSRCGAVITACAYPLAQAVTWKLVWNLFVDIFTLASAIPPYFIDTRFMGYAILHCSFSRALTDFHRLLCSFVKVASTCCEWSQSMSSFSRCILS
jgi:hypothetical protein